MRQRTYTVFVRFRNPSGASKTDCKLFVRSAARNTAPDRADAIDSARPKVNASGAGGKIALECDRSIDVRWFTQRITHPLNAFPDNGAPVILLTELVPSSFAPIVMVVRLFLSKSKVAVTLYATI